MTQHPIHDATVRAMHEIESWFEPAHYHQTSVTTTPGAAVSLAQIEQGIHTAIADVIDHMKGFEQNVAPHLAGLADVATQVTQSPLVQTVLAAVLSPEDETLIVSLVRKLDQGAHALEAAAGQQMPAAGPAQPIG